MDGTTGFLARIGAGRTYEDAGAAASGPSVTPTGGLPGPFDALDGRRLAGPSGSHPLAGVQVTDLLRRATDGLRGTIELSGPVRVGEGISGRIRVEATRPLNARSAYVRLVGILASEQSRSGPTRSAEASAAAAGAANAASAAAAAAAAAARQVPPGGSAPAPTARTTPTDTSTVSWVEVHGKVIEESRFTEPVLPLQLVPGMPIEVPFSVPAPRLGPASAHAGVALVAWAIEAHWDLPMIGDQWLATIVPVGQHPDLLRSGAVTLPPGTLFDAVDDEGARLAVQPLPPMAAGTPVTLSVAWPGAPGGRSARVELTTDVRATTSTSVVSVSLQVDHGRLGGLDVVVPLPADLPPTLVTDGLSVTHRLRVIVDRKLRSDVTAERPLGTL